VLVEMAVLVVHIILVQMEMIQFLVLSHLQVAVPVEVLVEAQEQVALAAAQQVLFKQALPVILHPLRPVKVIMEVMLFV
jgi:hypothetical protein